MLGFAPLASAPLAALRTAVVVIPGPPAVTPLRRIITLGGGLAGRWIGINVIGWRTEE